ncbi:MAG: oligosaccharide flippase family protein [Anaerolineae bacterium]|nr:oligosaccharide flippase family protein [Anaerolineae bacterium]
MRRRLPDLAIIALLLLLPLILFWQQTVGGRTLLPAENLYQYEPYATYREVAGAPAIPHNHLVSDLVLQNMQFRTFIRSQLAQGEIPLWNPHQFSGVPFFAAGQHAVLYPFSAIFYVMDLPAAYGWYTVSQLWLAGLFMLLFVRGLGVGRFGGAVAGIIYQLSAFFVISVVFPMIVGAAIWLPLILLMAENVIRAQPIRGRPARPIWAIIGAAALGCNVLSGHVEITYYTLLVTAFYAAGRLIGQIVTAWRAGETRLSALLPGVDASVLWLAIMVGLGMALGAVQFIPIFEAANGNFRSGSASLDQVLGWAHPMRDLLQFALPNFYGNPAHHTIFDVFSGQNVPVTFNALGASITNTEWGIKNYVEGALYVGILPLALAVYALLPGKRGEGDPPLGIHKITLAVLGLLALTFMFGLPTYALLYKLPGIDQLHSPFRWVFPLTVCVAALAGFGAHRLLAVFRTDAVSEHKLARRIGYVLSGAGLLVLAGLVFSHLFYAQVEPLVMRVFDGMAQAVNAFPDARTFYSYEFTNLLVFGLMLLCGGFVFLLATPGRRRLLNAWQIGVVVLIAADLMIASWDFNPASDPALLDFTPPAIEWLQGQPGEWRYTTIDDPTLGERGKIMIANVGMRYGFDDIRGYESIIPGQYVDFMKEIAPQPQLEFNRVAPFYTDEQYAAMGYDFHLRDALDSPLLGLLNVRYVITSRAFSLPEDMTTSPDPRRLPAAWALAYEDEAVRIWQQAAAPRAFVAQLYDETEMPDLDMNFGIGFDVTRGADTGREQVLHANITQQPSWLVVSESYAPGWRAFVRPRGGGEDSEQQIPVERLFGNLMGMNVSRSVVGPLYDGADLPEAQRIAVDNGQITVRLVYSPTSFQVGAFATFIGAAVAVLMIGMWLWRAFVVVPEDERGATARIAKNSVAPIVLNLFNRGIDFAFAAVMLRLLGPNDAGLYYYAIVIFGWFDIFTNFGLNLFVIREAARDRSQTRRLFVNTSVLRLILAVIGVPLLIAFLAARQSTGAEPLAADAILAIVLLYVGLAPSSLSTGLTAVYYAHEKAEIPAAVATVSTMCKAVFGLAALVLGYGFVGLAAASILTNVITLVILWWNARGWLAPEPAAEASPGRGLDFSLMRGMIRESYPLMLNHFLASIFFKIDVILIEVIHNATMVGQYSQAYKWVEAINIIPSFFTQALLPVMSRQTRDDHAAFRRTYELAIKLLVMVSLPLAVFFTVSAEFLTEVLAGPQFLPEGAIALRLMIWSIPIGWMNSLTQYALIALDLQRLITRAFVIGVSFNLITNLIFIPQYGFQAAAITTIFSELALLIPFAILMQRSIGKIDWLDLVWRPFLATGAMVAVVVPGWAWAPVPALAVSVVVYVGVLVLLRPLSADEWTRLAPLLPARLRRLRPAAN